MSLVSQTPKLGRLLLTGIGIFFIWFSIWILVTPFYNDPCMLQLLALLSLKLDFLAFFPERRWAIQIPVTLGVVLITAVLVFVGRVLQVG
jgi:hypothetical protein